MLEIHCKSAAVSAYIFPSVNLLEQAPTNGLATLIPKGYAGNTSQVSSYRCLHFSFRKFAGATSDKWISYADPKSAAIAAYIFPSVNLLERAPTNLLQ